MGYRRQLPFQIAIDAGLVHRDYRDRTTQIDDQRDLRGRVEGLKNPDLNQIFQITANRFNSVEYDAPRCRHRSRPAVSRSWRPRQSAVAPDPRGSFTPSDPAAFGPGHSQRRGHRPGVHGRRPAENVACTVEQQPVRQPHVEGPHRRSRDGLCRALGRRVATTCSFQSGPSLGPVVTRIAAADTALRAGQAWCSPTDRVRRRAAARQRSALPIRREAGGSYGCPACVCGTFAPGAPSASDGARCTPTSTC